MDILDILKSVREGKISVESAARNLRFLATKEIENACLDLCRETRKGVPEIIFAENKSLEDLLRIAKTFFEENGRVIITRITEHQAAEVRKILGGKEKIQYNKKGRVMVLTRSDVPLVAQNGKVAVITAGSTDIGVAEEASVILRELGCKVISVYDVGIAGIHRLFPAIRRIVEEDVDAVIVIAGMEGALPSIVSGLVAVPVVGVPTSSGYGAGGRGEGALIAMLQSCSPGLVVVNIDNGVGAAVAAALIAKRANEHSQ